MLPYVEQQNLYNQASNTVIYKTPVKLFYCPGRRSSQIYHNWAHSDYAGNGGQHFTQHGSTGVFVRTFTNPTATSPTVQRRRLNDINSGDGTSNTIAIGEKLLNPKNWGYDGGDNEPWVNAGWDSDVVRFGWNKGWNHGGVYQDKMEPARPPTVWPYAFGSSHTSGANFVFCDGSVHMINFSVNPVTFMYLCMYNDGMPANLP